MIKLYDMPYEMRMRYKYAMFGFILGVTTMVFMAISYPLGNILRLVYNTTDKVYTLTDYTAFLVMNIILLAVCIYGCYWMWTTKEKPRKRPELENIGLKYDWDKLKGEHSIG